MNYYTYKVIAGGSAFRARIYTYDVTGSKEETVWESQDVYPTREAAEDAAVEYAEANDIEVELG